MAFYVIVCYVSLIDVSLTFNFSSSLSFFVQGKINAQGPLLRQGTLSVSESISAPKWKERRIFLFEQIIILSEPLEKKKGFSNPGYIFKNSMKVSGCLRMPFVSDSSSLSERKERIFLFEQIIILSEFLEERKGVSAIQVACLK